MTTRDIISHIGIAVADLDKSLALYRLLTGVDSPEVTEVPEQKVKVAIFSGRPGASSDAGGRIELVAATSADSPIAKFLERHGEGLHHLCLFVDDIEAKLAELRAQGVRLIDETPRIGAEGKRIAFVHPSGTGGVLIELQER